MRHHILTISITLFLLTLLALTFKPSENDVPVVKIREHYKKTLEQLEKEITHLLTLTQNYRSKKEDLKILRRQFQLCRTLYKKIEFLVEAFEPGIKSINGPNIPRLDQSQSSYHVLEPQGFQVIEELLHATDRPDTAVLRTQIHMLIENIRLLKQAYPVDKIKDWFVIEAIRFEVWRIATQGLSGLDSPIARQSIQESTHAWQAIFTALEYYKPYFKKYSPHPCDSMYSLLKQGLDYLNTHTNVEKFDHLTFMRDYIIPLYAEIGKCHLASGLETYEEAKGATRPVNYKALNPFDKNFINPNYYAKNLYNSRIQEKVALGNLLFFDPVLSFNNQRSCASCHQPDKAFTDGLPKSIAFDFKGHLQRNAPTVINAALQSAYFHDMRAAFLEDQVKHVTNDPDEFNSNYSIIINRLNQSSQYKKLFERAFPDEKNPINEHTINSALAAYIRTLIALDSPFDKYMRKEIQDINPAVKRGFNLFMGKANCGTCHFPPHFGGMVPPYYLEAESEVLGVPANNDFKNPVPDTDPGRDSRNYSVWFRSFKTPSLRNVELTAPYMHNGALLTLDEVIHFYNEGGGVGLGMNIPNQTLMPDKLHLTKTEKQDLIAFMKALTDTSKLKTVPAQLPDFEKNSSLSQRKIGGEY
ncbi:MAG: cytochrome-c peroxidase [Cytophagaceae bacterium]|nr:cytochrome-c peroxidase [Cytophagaceae bacterium]MDW8455739.1 cytochrome c peroxidase [Cytophagaceae bacterium]